MAAAASSIVGNNILSRLLDRHNRWPFGGLAELLHNSADADASLVSVGTFPTPVGADPFHPHFALDISDDGKGMDHGDMVRMMRIGADESIGRKDKRGKIGGYGVGFKAGSLATAHTAVVLSSCLEKRTVSVGLLSNEPYEERHERPHVGLVATQSMDTAMVDEETTTVEGRDRILDLIAKINPCLTRERIALWSGQMHGKSGTTVYLCGVRRNPDLPGRMIYEFVNEKNGGDGGKSAGEPVVGEYGRGDDDKDVADMPDLRLLAPGASDRDMMFDEFPGRYDDQNAPMDYSLRAYLGLMFKSRTPKIRLFGADVAQRDLAAELVYRRRVDLDLDLDVGVGSDSAIRGDVGLHPPSEKRGLSGAMLYCENVLVSSYARQEFEIPPDERRLGVLLVVDLPKSTSESRTVHDRGFKPKDNKLGFDWAGKKRFRRKLRAEFLAYEDWADAERDRKNPLRTALRKVVEQAREELERRYGPNSSGSMVGVLKLPLYERALGRTLDGVETHTSYHQSISRPVSLQELSDRIEKGEIYTVDDKGSTDAGLAKFREDLELVFRNVQYWHSKCRWHPDNEVEDLALLSHAEDGNDEAMPFHTTNNVFTIREICRHLKIPRAFRPAIVENNSEYGDINQKTKFQVGTTILLPHHLDRQAYKDAEEMLGFVLQRLENAERILKRQEKARLVGSRDCWIQCERRGCRKWRRVDEEYAKRFEDTDREWTCETEGSPVVEGGCRVPQDPGYDPAMMVEVRAAGEVVRPSSNSTSSAGMSSPSKTKAAATATAGAKSSSSAGTSSPKAKAKAKSTAAGARISISSSASRGSSSKKRSRLPGGGGNVGGTKPDKRTRPGGGAQKRRSRRAG
uniref:CW-type domain-containing protein n=1 Tax=Odontella aurita TaxID=265563 RepID=A0A7S4MLF4_9STRA